MESEESVGSVELKKILDSFEAGEVLPEVTVFFCIWSTLDTFGVEIIALESIINMFDPNGQNLFAS